MIETLQFGRDLGIALNVRWITEDHGSGWWLSANSPTFHFGIFRARFDDIIICTMTSQSNNLGLSLWLMPPESFKPSSALTKLTSTSFPASPNFPQSPPITPHITLTSSIPATTQLLLPSLNLDSVSPPDVEFGELAHGEKYFKYIFLRIKKTTSLLALAKYVRERLLSDVKAFEEGEYDPHISLVYSNEAATEKRVEYVAWKTSMAIGSSTGWKGGKVALVDTRSTNVGDWKIVEEWSFPEA